MTTINEWPAQTTGDLYPDINMLAQLLHACVWGGAGVSFVTPFSLDEARAFWFETVLPVVRTGKRRVLVSRTGNRIVGSVQLDLDTPPNQPHRAGVTKLLVHPDARRQGIGRRLMLALEEMARSERRTLLTLDTVTGSAAEVLYRSLGFEVVGVIPDYARAALSTDMEGTTVMYKRLTG
ncbi:MAG TPA: GNAT family N-acetyltransferase [Pyrinomonadaceae bacterium]|nr:GNAT family N-acetyltransferase [Pyrinomonadaceae bacterium]